MKHIAPVLYACLNLCLCSCGNEVNVTGTALVNRKTKSCGCYKRDFAGKQRKLEFGESAFNLLLSSYKYTAKRYGREFLLTKEEFRELVLCNCSYCGRAPHKEKENTCNNGNFKYTGIDRIDNTKGYVKGNVRPCCWQCNNIKSNYDTEDFLLHVKTIYAHLNL